MLEKLNLKKNNFNICLSLLRIYLSFLVVNAHCLDIKKNIYTFLIKNFLPVPTFYIMSFYFFHKTLLSKNIEKFIQRFERLLIPYIIWPIIIWILHNLLYILSKFYFPLYFRDLIIQLLTGHRYIQTLWFQLNLILETGLFIIILLIFKNNIIFILLNIELFAYILQYSNYNFKIYSNLNYEIKYSLGRFAEIIPFSVSGFMMSYFGFIDYLRKYRMKCLYLNLIIFIIICKYEIFNKEKGFFYSGIKLNILSICLFINFSIININIQNTRIIGFIKEISKFTYGIYFLHIPVMKYLNNYIKIIKYRNLFGSILIFIICFIICLIANKLFYKSKLIYLFK